MCFYVRAFVLFCLRVFVSAFSCLCFCVFMFCVKAHRKETQRENTDRKHRERTQRRNTERKHTQKTQTVQTFLWWCFCGVWLSFGVESFQNDRFVRGFLQLSQNELPKRAFRTRLPQNFTEKASKMIVSREASSKFQRKSFQKDRFVRGFLQIS